MTAAPTPAPGRKRRPLLEGLGFFGAFLGRPGSIGAVVPSSRYLARALVGRLELAPGDLVVEFGPGTGPVTAVLQEALPAHARYLGIELAPNFHAMLTQRFPSMPFHLGSAGDLVQILAERGLPKPRRIVSGLPFASLPTAVQDAVIDGVVASLAPGGDFRTFQYLHAYGMRRAKRFRARMDERFASVERIGPVFRNVPPAYVLRYWNARG